jgi:hypothetical protein
VTASNNLKPSVSWIHWKTIAKVLLRHEIDLVRAPGKVDPYTIKQMTSYGCDVLHPWYDALVSGVPNFEKLEDHDVHELKLRIEREQEDSNSKGRKRKRVQDKESESDSPTLCQRSDLE